MDRNEVAVAIEQLNEAFQKTETVSPFRMVPNGVWMTGKIENLFAMLSMVQRRLKNPAADRVAQVDDHIDGRSYEHKFASLPLVLDTIRAACADTGMTFTQAVSVVDGKSMIHTILVYEAEMFGTSVEVLSPIGSGTQAWASMITSVRRGVLCALFGIATAGDDDDGNAASRNKAVITDRTPRSKPDEAAAAVSSGRGRSKRQQAAQASPDEAGGDAPAEPPSPAHQVDGARDKGSVLSAEERAKLMELPKRIRAMCVDDSRGEIDVEQAERFWMDAMPGLEKLSPMSVADLADRYQQIVGSAPPKMPESVTAKGQDGADAAAAATAE